MSEWNNDKIEFVRKKQLEEQMLIKENNFYLISSRN